MCRKFSLICWALAVMVPSSLAQPVDDPPSGFGAPVLGAPPREESGPLDKKSPDRFAPAPPVDQTTPAPQDAVAPPVSASASTFKPYVDGLMSGLVTAGEIPGAAIVIIQDGKIVLKAGYGFADIRARTPVDPDRTRFRVASISKLFTATAVMQIVEQGKADLNADVNTYLSSFKIPSNYPEAVTLANLLTHTAGFDDRYLGLGAPLQGPVLPLGQYLSRQMPPRVLAPNTVIAYSNHGYALAGHIIENVSGQEFNAYAREHIFTPLGMTVSSFGVPYPLPADIAVPYLRGGDEGGYSRIALDRVATGPAGDLITTAADMVPFMLAHLSKGAYGDGEHLLSEPTIEKMHAGHFANAEGLDDWAYGFAGGRRNGIRWIGHDGSWSGFCAQLVLHPETRSGFFVATNVNCSFASSASLKKALFDLVWPNKSEPIVAAGPEIEARARAIAGTYMSVRRARSDFTVMGAAASQMTVKAMGEGQLQVFLPSVGHDLVFQPQMNGTWVNPDFQWKAAAQTSAKGDVQRFIIDTDAYDRVTGTGEWAMWSVALALVVAICIMTIWGWANGFLSRHFFGEPQAVITFAPRITGFLAAGLTVAMLVAMEALLSNAAPIAILHGPSPALLALLAIPVVIAVLAIPMVIWSISGFGAGPRARMAQMGYIVLTLAILAFIAFAWQWGLHPFGVLGAQ